MNFLKALFGGKEKKPENEAQNEDSKNFDVLKYDGVRALRANKAAYAVQCLTHALQIKEDLEVRDYLSQAYLRIDQSPKAFEQLQLMSDAQPENQLILIRMAHVAYMMEDYGAMLNACEKALLIDNTTPEVFWLYAKACIGQADTSNAVAMLTKALQLKADFMEAYLLRGETLFADKDLEKADEDVMTVLDANADNEDALMLKARIERAKGDENSALDYFSKVMDVNPFRIEAYRESGEIMAANGDADSAKEMLDKAVELEQQQTADNETAAVDRVKNAYKSADVYGVFSNIIDNS